MNPSTPEEEYYNLVVNTYNTFYTAPPTWFIPNYIHYCEIDNTMEFTKKKEYSNVAVQTESAEQLGDTPFSSEYSSHNEISQKAEFPIPNKPKLLEIFCNSNIKRKDVRAMIQEMCKKESKTLNNFYKSIEEKMVKFKKTKEEIIKFLIRKTWKKQKVGANESREKYYSEYKSMNSAYLQKIFSEESFVLAFEEMLKNFDSDFDSFNEERFNRFYDYLLNCYVKNNLAEFKASKECKSKLPYPHWWKEEILEIANGLYESYCKKPFSLKMKLDLSRKDLETMSRERKNTEFEK